MGSKRTGFSILHINAFDMSRQPVLQKQEDPFSDHSILGMDLFRERTEAFQQVFMDQLVDTQFRVIQRFHIGFFIREMLHRSIARRIQNIVNVSSSLAFSMGVMKAVHKVRKT